MSKKKQYCSNCNKYGHSNKECNEPITSAGIICLDVHDNFKNTIVGSETNGTLILNKKSKPCIRALKTNLTNEIYEKGVMEMSEMMGIKNLYFDGDMEAAPALAGQSVGLIDKVKSVEEIINETIVEFNQTVSRLNESKFNE